MSLHLQGEQVFLCELQVIVITKPPKHSPGGLVSASLYEEGVQEQEACNKDPMMEEWMGSVVSNCKHTEKTSRKEELLKGHEKG